MSNTIKFGDGQWATKEDSILAYNDENANFKPLPFVTSRASTATTVNKAGLLETVASGVPRVNYLGNSKGSYLLEPSRTNLIPYSNDLSNNIYVKSNVTFTGQTTTAPDGSQVEFLTVDDYLFLNINAIGGSAPSTVRTISFYVKAQGEDYQIAYRPPNSFTPIIQDVSSTEWTRVVATGLHTVTSMMLQDNRTLSSVGNVAFWGVQLENGYPTSYIPTSGSIQTRLADTASQTVPDGIINSSEGVLYFEGSSIANNNTYKQISISDGTSNNIITFDYTSSNNAIRSFIKSNGGTGYSMSSSITDALSVNKFAVKWKDNDFALWINGVEVDTNASALAPLNLSDLKFDNGSGGNNLYGNCKDLKVYHQILSDSELTTLTTI